MALKIVKTLNLKIFTTIFLNKLKKYNLFFIKLGIN